MVAQKKEIDLIGERVAAIYGRALFDAAVASENCDAVLEQLDSLITEVLDRSPQLETLFANPMIAVEDKKRLIQSIFSATALPLVLSFLQTLANNARLGYLRSIVSHVHRLNNEVSNVQQIGATTAVPLTAELEQNLREAAARVLGSQVELETDVDPSMIGGVMLRIGDTVYDGSIAARLERLRKQMSHGVVEAIETDRSKFEN